MNVKSFLLLEDYIGRSIVKTANFLFAVICLFGFLYYFMMAFYNSDAYLFLYSLAFLLGYFTLRVLLEIILSIYDIRDLN